MGVGIAVTSVCAGLTMTHCKERAVRRDTRIPPYSEIIKPFAGQGPCALPGSAVQARSGPSRRPAPTHPLPIELRRGRCPHRPAWEPVRRNALATLGGRCKKRERRGRSLFSLLYSPGQQSLAPAGMESSSSSRCSFSSPFSLCTAEMSMPQEGMPIIFRAGRFKMATAVLPTRSSGS